MKKLLLILVPVFLFSCRGKENKTAGNGEFFEINCEEAFSNSREICLSEAASDLEYIMLETNDSCPVASRAKYFFTDDYIFIQNRDHALKFSRDGKFLMKIGKPGKGPGEIDLIRVMSVIPEVKEIVVQPLRLRKLYHFSFDGKLLKTLDFTHPGSDLIVCPDGKYVAHNAGNTGKEDITFCLLNEKLDTLSNVKNHQKWENTSGTYMSIYYTYDPFYLADGSIYFKSMHNDTVYSTEGSRIWPVYSVKLGKYTLPFELRPEKLGVNGLQQFQDNSHKYNYASVLKSGSLFFISAHCYGKAPGKKVIYNPKTKEAVMASLSDSQQGGLLNDWDGAMPFWPVGNATGNQVFMPVSIMTLKKRLETKITGEIEFPEKREQLKKMIEAADISDNPVLVMVTLK